LSYVSYKLTRALGLNPGLQIDSAYAVTSLRNAGTDHQIQLYARWEREAPDGEGLELFGAVHNDEFELVGRAICCWAGCWLPPTCLPTPAR